MEYLTVEELTEEKGRLEIRYQLMSELDSKTREEREEMDSIGNLIYNILNMLSQITYNNYKELSI